MKKTLKQYLFEYRSAFQKQSFETFHWLIVAIISVQEVRSVKFLYENFIEKYCDKIFWFLDKYMVRNKKAVERYVNLLAIAYTFVSVLHFWIQDFKNINLCL